MSAYLLDLAFHTHPMLVNSWVALPHANLSVAPFPEGEKASVPSHPSALLQRGEASHHVHTALRHMVHTAPGDPVSKVRHGTGAPKRS